MNEELNNQDVVTEESPVVNSWEKAFELVNSQEPKEAEESNPAEDQSAGSESAQTFDAGSDSNDSIAGDFGTVSVDAGGSDTIPNQDTGINDSTGERDQGTIDLSQIKDQTRKAVEDRAIGEMREAFIKRGARTTADGKLGASLNDADICKRDEDGVPHFYNPETGREFTGDNPRRQAQEWVDDYNKSIAESFNKSCENYVNHLMEQEAPRLAVIEFEPTYTSLDPIRQQMLDMLLEDYEIKDSDGDVIGYSCDLNKALATVNRQVEKIQSSYKEIQKQPTGPAVDMNTVATSSQPDEKPQFNNLAEALEFQQNELLKSMRKGK